MNPVSELSGDYVELRGTEDGTKHLKVAFDPEPVEQFVPEFYGLDAIEASLQLPFAGRLQTWIDDKNIDAKFDSMYRTPTYTVLYKRPTPQESKRNCVIEGTRWQLEVSEDYLKNYSDMVREGRREDLTNAVNLILPNVKDVQILTDENGESYLSAITDNGAQRRLENLGGGIVRLLKLYLNFFAARNGLVLIDEVENGLHYSVLRNLWDRIRIWTCEWNVQFIATTHSAECIDAAMEAFADEPNDLSIHNLFANESGNIKAATFTGEALEGARNLNLGGPMMIATGRAGLPKIELMADRLLLVEGKDEVNLLGRLIKDCLKDDGQGIQILDVGSKDNFRPNLRGIKVAAQARPTLRSIGVIRDADDNANGSFDSVCGSLRSAGYEPPPAHAEVLKRGSVNWCVHRA